MANTDKRKQSLYFPEEMLEEIRAEATRQDRSLSWIVQKAWKVARQGLAEFPSVSDMADGAEDERGRAGARASSGRSSRRATRRR
jgi:uncharacterized small protein (TIGR04563 family)